jgi:hypothetical protein
MKIVRFEVLTAGKMSVLLFWVVLLPYGFVGRYQCFGGTYFLHLRVSVHFSNTLVSTHKPHGSNTDQKNNDHNLKFILLKQVVQM